METDFSSELYGACVETCGRLPEQELHRFHVPIRPIDLYEDRDDPLYVLPPSAEQLATEGAPVAGLSFFRPIHTLFNPAHEFLVKSTGVRHCHLTTPNSDLPGGLGITQDTLYEFRPFGDIKSNGYASDFKQMSSKQRKDYGMYIHGAHYLVYPVRRMLLSEFSELVQQLSDCVQTQCTFEAGGVSTSRSCEQSPGALLPTADTPTQLEMRFVCDALFHYFTTSTDPNYAAFAYLLFHHLAATNATLPQLLQMGDCSTTRTVAVAMRNYEPPSDLPTGPSVCSYVSAHLDRVVPKCIYSDADDDNGSLHAWGLDWKIGGQK